MIWEAESELNHLERWATDRDSRVSEAPSHGLPVSLYAPGSSAAKAYAGFADEFLAAFGNQVASRAGAGDEWATKA